MKEIIKLLDRNLNYLYHEILDDTIYIYVESQLKAVECPYCGTLSIKNIAFIKEPF